MKFSGTLEPPYRRHLRAFKEVAFAANRFAHRWPDRSVSCWLHCYRTTLGPFPLSLPSATIIINTSARGGKWRRWEGGRGKDVVGEEEV
uniref:Uncharacterized protein n=1 Tax=Oryza sativa subsp. japonica TaxID=39947 RepID=Q6EQU1_ORYSJ|nr:hypothetical protein [Oryza sativa Japonica Group]